MPQPVLISEFGCTDDGGAERREGEHEWRIDADAKSLAAWRRTFAAKP